ncbi:minor tail protein [Mycobacterium phage Gail]|uniref:Minor tail protein n=1 Tax=Mycobacterium phage Gail TaxID=2743994 RepID=A0A7D5KCI1_9CAUD|nr:minor tail protein [Mycobacterium phage Gail]QLF84595.1 minor tail protein [Mycobacterium phage Gail]
MDWPTNPLEAIGADGAFEIGGGEFDFGQGYTETLVKNLFAIPTPDVGNALDLLRDQLLKLPLETLQKIGAIMPDVLPGDFDTPLSSVNKIMSSLSDPVFFKRADWQDFLDQIKGAVGGTIEDLIEKFNHTRDQAIQIIKDLLTGLTGATDDDILDWINNLGGIFTGIINPNQLPLIPISHLGDWAANLLPRGDLDGAISIDGGTDWLFDSTVFQSVAGRTTPGSAKTTANGTTKELLSEDLVFVTPGQKINVTGFLRHVGLTATGSPLEVGLETYSDLAGKTMVSRPTLYAPSAPSGTTSGWLPVSGTYTVPSTVKTFRVRLTVKPTATAGAVHFDQVMPHKSGLLARDLIDGLEDRIKWLTSGGLFDASKLDNLDNIPQIPNGLDKIKELQDLVDAATNALSGASQEGSEIIGAGLDAAKATFENLFSMLTKATRDIQALKSEQDANNSGGRRYNIDFGDYPDGPFPSGLFNMTYSGPGTSTLGIKDGHAVWNLVDNGDRDCLLLYPQPTLTPFQVVRGTLASPPSDNSSGQKPRIWSIARANAAGTDYVFARGYCTGFLTYRGDIGCVKGGVEYVWASNVPLTWSLDMQIICGVGTNARRHQVLSGNKLVIDITEPAGAQSIVDDNHCYWGSYTETNGKQTPGNVAGASVVDNAPPTVTGTTMRVFRSTTAAASKNNGESFLPANLFDAVSYKSPDITWNPATSEATVEKAGTYLCTIRIEVDQALNTMNTWYPTWTVDTVKRAEGDTQDAITIAAFGAPAFSRGTHVGGDPFVYYVPAGGKIRPGMGASNDIGLIGDTQGAKTWLTITKIA